MCRKGENIRKRKDGRWEARYIKCRDGNGQIQYGSIYGKSYRDVKEKRNKKIAELPGYGARVKNTGILAYQSTLEKAIPCWCQDMRYTIKDSTFSNYETIVRKHIVPELGTLKICRLTNQHILRFVQKMREQGFSTGTIHVTLSVLRSILKYAAREGVYTAEAIRYPRLNGGRANIQIMNAQNYQMLEQFLTEHMNSFHFGLLLCMHTGIRVGELSGLRWEDVDLEQQKISIRRTVLRIRNLDQVPDARTKKIPKTILYIGPPKTEHSAREIPLPDKLLAYTGCFVKSPKDYILTDSSHCMEPRVIQRKYASLLKSCEIPPVKIHALRHQFSCRWVERGFDTKSLSEILGHTSVRTTLDLYVHIQTETKRQYMNELMEDMSIQDMSIQDMTVKNMKKHTKVDVKPEVEVEVESDVKPDMGTDIEPVIEQDMEADIAQAI